MWSVGGRTTSLQMPGAGMVKAVDRFSIRHTCSEAAFQELIRECSDYGCARPSSYGSVFHAVYKSPRVRRSLQAPFEPWFAGGWQEAKMTGVIRGRWRRYDLNSAYLWACTLGLPEIRSVRVSTAVGSLPGMYALELAKADESLPYPFNMARTVCATTEEIDLYALPVKKILGGVTWTDSIDGQPIVDTVKQFTFAKEVSKTFWGRWCSTIPVECETRTGKRWPLRNPIQNLVWAHLLVSRVKQRVWNEGRNAAHVFVDSIITTDVLPTGAELGAWREEREYPDGLTIRHAGFYGSGGVWEKVSGARL